MIVTTQTKESVETPTLGKSISNDKSEKSDIFAHLLHGITTASKDEKELPNGLVLLNLVDEDSGIDLSALNSEKKEEGNSKELLALLNIEKVEVSDEQKDFDSDIKFLNQKFIKNLDEKEVRVLIKEAKSYLKNQIVVLEPQEEIPHTLKGLVKMSKDLGIKIERISIKEIVDQSKNLKEPISTSQIKHPLESIKEQLDFIAKEDTSARKLFTKELNSFITQTPKEHTTAQIVQLKSKEETGQEKKESKTSSLQSLLKGSSKTESEISSSRVEVFKEVVSKISEPMKSTDSSASVALETTLNEKSPKEGTKRGNLNELLGSSEKSSSFTPLAKAESLDVKVLEAKQLTRHFSSELKQAVEDYKPPFTKLEMKLNPAKFGDVDLTMVQRGNNVHIMVNSNTQAITAMMQNVQDLKNQLAQNGMGNATLNFSSGDGQPNQGQNHQQNSQQQRNQELLEQYEYAENSSEYETANALEIVLPRYI